MKYKFFKIPIDSLDDIGNEFNQFLAQYRVTTIDKEFVENGDSSFWAISVVYMEQDKQKPSPSYKNRIDYKEVLSEEDFTLYANLRELRKEMSIADGIPAYTVFTNEQLAKIVQDEIVTITALQAIEGVGKARLDKYGKVFIERMEQLLKIS